MKLIITIDTEADNQWARSETLELRNIDYIPRFQDLGDQYGFKPTYLITYTMATSEHFIQTVGPYQQAGKAEIGAHLHPWSNPPLIALTDNDHQHHPFPHEYPEDDLRAKLTTLTNAIESHLGQRPLTFRAGRYGFDATVASLLSELGYIADCSVTPLTSWRSRMGDPQRHGGPDFAGAPYHPYWVNMNDVTTEGDSGLLEVPMSIFFLQWPILNRIVRIFKRIFKDPHDILLRGLYKLHQKPVWLRPLPDKRLEDMTQIYHMARSLKLDYIEMMFHSSELMPGGSKNTKDARAIERLYTLFEAFFQFLSEEQVQSMTLAEYAAEKKQQVEHVQ
jgi:peptidoglycan/xylan/chitin deacetylase (PgdA/CDA1 family)